MAEARFIDTPGVAPDERATDRPSLAAAIDRSPVAALEPKMAALDTVLTGIHVGRSAARAHLHALSATDSDDAPLCARQGDNVDIEILEWIVSHARGKRPLTRSSH
jgi:hypothetical protein